MQNEIKTIGDAFQDVPEASEPGSSLSIYDQVIDVLKNIPYLNIGSKQTGVRADDQSGLWIGAKTFADAVAGTFAVGLDGVLYATGAVISGAISASTIDIGGADATSFHVDVAGNMWLGAATLGAAPFSVTNAGVMTATSGTFSGTISGGTIDIGGADSTSFHVDASGNVWAGNATLSGAPFKIESDGDLTATSFSLVSANIISVSNGMGFKNDIPVTFYENGNSTLSGLLKMSTANVMSLFNNNGKVELRSTNNTIELIANNTTAAIFDSSGNANFNGVNAGNIDVGTISSSGITIDSGQNLVFAGTQGSINCGNIDCDAINVNSQSITNVNQISGGSGNMDFNETGRLQVSDHLDPPDGGGKNLGGSSRYWGDISYKTLTDRGCLGWFDEGVELQDGRTVSDVEALLSIKKHPTKMTVYGKPMLDYSSLPKSVYKPARDHSGKEFKRDKKTGEPLPFKEKLASTGEEVEYLPQDGAETTALISIMLGAIKQQAGEMDTFKKALRELGANV